MKKTTSKEMTQTRQLSARYRGDRWAQGATLVAVIMASIPLVSSAVTVTPESGALELVAARPVDGSAENGSAMTATPLSAEPLPVAGIAEAVNGFSGTQGTAATCEDIIYQNTTAPGQWYKPGIGVELIDYGTSDGGTVCSFRFGYVTESLDPCDITVRFYSGTNGSTCPGTLLAGWTFSGLNGSADGGAYSFTYTFNIPAGQEFTLPSGEFGYSYIFNKVNTGAYLADGGTGQENYFWKDCSKTWFGGTPHAGTFMEITAEGSSNDHCYTPPTYDYTLTPTTSWQVESTESIDPNGCRIYQMSLLASQSYNFSTCPLDYVGGSCTEGDTDFEMFDSTGASLWYMDGDPCCAYYATTLYSGSYEDWSPPSDGTYYLKVSDYFYGSTTYELAYKAGLTDPNIAVSPESVVFDCGGVGSEEALDSTIIVETPETATALSLSSEAEAEAVSSEASGLTVTRAKPVGENPWKAIAAMQELDSAEIVQAEGIDKLVDADVILEEMATNGSARVIVNLRTPIRQYANTDFTDKQSMRRLRSEVARRQSEVFEDLTPGDFQFRHVFSNIAGFSGTLHPDAIDKLLAHPMVASIEPVVTVEAHTGQGIPLMNASTVRSTHDGSGMAIAICDTGVDYTHPMLGGGGFPNSKVIGGYDFGEDDADPMPVGNAHGTACAGISAGDIGSTGDYIGGVAPGAKLVAMKITPDNSGSASSDDMAAAWDWCVTHQNDDPANPIMVISTSFGGGRYYSSCDGAGEVSSRVTAANNAVAAGITLLASSGNDGFCDSISRPACISNVISVGAVWDYNSGTAGLCVTDGSCNTLADEPNSCGSGTFYTQQSVIADDVIAYSNTASFLGLLAPSHNAYTTDIVGSSGYSSGDYASSFGGTSAACPYAAGAVACLQSAAMAQYGAYLPPSQVSDILQNTGQPITDTKVAITRPRIDLQAAVNSFCDSYLTISNNGDKYLNITDIVKPAWVSLDPTPPYTGIVPGSYLTVCMTAVCDYCMGSDTLSIVSNDPDESPYPYGVAVSGAVKTGDFDTTGTVDLADFALMATDWLDDSCLTPCGCGGVDMDEDGDVDLADFALFEMSYEGN